MLVQIRSKVGRVVIAVVAVMLVTMSLPAAVAEAERLAYTPEELMAAIADVDSKEELYATDVLEYECPPPPQLGAPWCYVDVPEEPDDIFRWSWTYAEKVYVGDDLRFTGGVENILDVPIMVSIKQTTEPPAQADGGATTDPVCSITSFTVDSAMDLSNLHPNTFVLAPQGQDLSLGTGVISDRAAFSLKGTGDAPGTCTVELTAGIAVGDGFIALDDSSASTEVNEPPATEGYLGEVVVDCLNQDMQYSETDEFTGTVLAGTRLLSASIHIEPSCNLFDDPMSMLNILDEDWERISGGPSNYFPETDYVGKVQGAATLDEGEHTFVLFATFQEQWFTFSCLLTVAGFAAIGALVGGIGALVAAIIGAVYCVTSKIEFMDDFEVTITAVGPDKMLFKLINSVASTSTGLLADEDLQQVGDDFDASDVVTQLQGIDPQDGIDTVVFDGEITQSVVDAASDAGLATVLGTSKSVLLLVPDDLRVLTDDDFETDDDGRVYINTA